MRGLTKFYKKMYNNTEVVKMDMYWNNKFIKKKYIWGIEESISARLVLEDIKKENLKNPKLIDLACGYGRDVNYYRNNGIISSGIDSAEEAIRIGKEQWNDLDIMCDDIFSHSYDKVDIITCNFIIHLLPQSDRERMVKLINDVLDKGGIVYFTVSSDQDCDFASGEVVGPNLVKNERGVTKFYYNEELIHKEFGMFSEVTIKEFREKHYHDFEHEHVNYFIKCKK